MRVEEHESFEREGSDLRASVTVSMVEAALGTDLVIPTLNGNESLRIPPGSQPGQVFRLKGKGMPRLHERGHGDLYLVLDVRVPEDITSEQRDLLLEFQRLETAKRDSQGLVERLKKAMRPRS